MLLCGSMLGPLRGKFSLPDRPRSARLDSVTQHASHLASKPSKFCSVCSTTRKSCPIRRRFYETPNCRALTVLIGNKSREQERGSIADSRQCQLRSHHPRGFAGSSEESRTRSRRRPVSAQTHPTKIVSPWRPSQSHCIAAREPKKLIRRTLRSPYRIDCTNCRSATRGWTQCARSLAAVASWTLLRDSQTLTLEAWLARWLAVLLAF